MQDRGFITLHRKIMDWGWYGEPNTARVFIHLLLCASYNTYEFRGTTIERGQVPFGRKKCARELNISERAVRTAIKHLISTNEVTIKATKQGSLITIVKYAYYQDVKSKSDQACDQVCDHQVTNERPTSDQRVTTTNKVNKENKVNNRETTRACVNENPLSFENNDKKALSIFIPPGREDIENHIRESGYKVNGGVFFDFYSAKGWKIGGDDMRDWKACLSAWEQREKQKSAPTAGFTNRAYTEEFFLQNDIDALKAFDDDDEEEEDY